MPIEARQIATPEYHEKSDTMPPMANARTASVFMNVELDIFMSASQILIPDIAVGKSRQRDLCVVGELTLQAPD